jgi:hypothetical protein
MRMFDPASHAAAAAPLGANIHALTVGAHKTGKKYC